MDLVEDGATTANRAYCIGLGDIKEVYIHLPNKQSPFNSSPKTSIESSNCNLVSRNKGCYGLRLCAWDLQFLLHM